MLNTRSSKVLYYLTQQTEVTSIKELANKFGVSERSIRNDLQEIDEWLKEAGFPQLDLIMRKGVKLAESGKEALSKMEVLQNDGYIMSAQERSWRILGNLLFGDGTLNTSKLPEMLDVSQSSVVNDMRCVYRWMTVNQIEINSRPHIGVYLEAGEEEIRKGCCLLLNEIVFSSFQRVLISDFSELKAIFKQYQFPDMVKALEKYRASILEVIHEIQKEYQYHFTDDGLCNVFLQMFVAAIRIENHKLLEQTSKLNEQYDRLYGEVTEIRFDRFFEMLTLDEIPEIENKYLNMVWHSANRESRKNSHSVFSQHEIQTFLHRIEEAFGYYIPWERDGILNISKDMDVFLNKHLLGLKFPYEDEIGYSIKNWEKEYELCKSLLTALISNKSRKVYQPTEYEVAEILVEVVSCLANSEFEALSNKHEIVVVSSEIVNESRLIKYRLEQLFSNVNEIKCLSYHEFLKVKDFLDYDILLSTIDLPEIEEKYYKISSVVTKEELINLVHVMQFRLPITERRRIVNETVNVMMRMPEIQKEQKLMLSMEIAKYLQERQYKEPNKSMKGLSDLLDSDLVKVQATVNSGDEAIQLAGDLLMHRGLIRQEQIDTMIDLNQKHHGYTVIDEGVAFPHLLTDVVDVPCISLVTLEHEVPMHEGGRSVSIIIMLISNDDTSHIAIIEDIIELLNDPQKKKKIREAKCAKDIRDVINPI